MVDRKITGLEVAGSSPVTITFYPKDGKDHRGVIWIFGYDRGDMGIIQWAHLPKMKARPTNTPLNHFRFKFTFG